MQTVTRTKALEDWMLLQICEYCGMGFERKKRGRFCDQECYQAWREMQPREAPSLGKYRGPTPDMRLLRKDAFGELDAEKWVEMQMADLRKRCAIGTVDMGRDSVYNVR